MVTENKAKSGNEAEQAFSTPAISLPKDGGQTFKDAAVSNLKTIIEQMALADGRKGLFRLFSLRNEFPSQWNRFLHPPESVHTQKFQFDLVPDHFPYLFQEKKITAKKLTVFLKLKNSFTYDSNKKPLTFLLAELPESPENSGTSWTFQTDGSSVPEMPFAGPIDLNIEIPTSRVLKVSEADLNDLGKSSDADWWKTVEIDDQTGQIRNRLNPEAIEDFWVVCEYTIGEEN